MLTLNKLWIDDVRFPPDVHDAACVKCAKFSPCHNHAGSPTEWEWVKTADEAKLALQTRWYHTVSFDNDLGIGKGEGYQIADWLEAKVHMGELRAPEHAFVHSFNPVAAERIRTTLRRFTLVD